MTPLEERIRGALWYAVAQYPGAQPLPDDAYTDLARAVVAVLPTASECPVCGSPDAPYIIGTDGHYCDDAWHDIDANTRRLLDAQAAAHAAEVDGWHGDLRRAASRETELQQIILRKNAELEALRVRIIELRDEGDYNPYDELLALIPGDTGNSGSELV